MLTWPACRESTQPEMGYAYPQGLGGFSKERDWEIIRAKGRDNLKEMFSRNNRVVVMVTVTAHMRPVHTQARQNRRMGG